MPGTTAVWIELKSSPVIVGQIVNWNLKMPPSAKQRVIALSPLFNDRVSQIFKNEYISPRSPFCPAPFQNRDLAAGAILRKLRKSMIADSRQRLLKITVYSLCRRVFLSRPADRTTRRMCCLFPCGIIILMRQRYRWLGMPTMFIF